MAVILLLPILVFSTALFLYLQSRSRRVFSCSGGKILLNIEKDGHREEVYLADPGLKRFIFSCSEFRSQPLWQSSPARKTELVFCCTDGFPEVISEGKMIFNGVSSRSGRLSPGTILRWSGWRISCIDYQRFHLSFSSHTLRLTFPVWFRSILLLLLFVSCLFALSLFVSVRAQSSQAATAAAIVSDTVNTATEQHEPKQSAMLEQGHLLTVAAGETIPIVKIDVLFVHAHPDDESLDYGALLSRLDLEGKRTAVLLLTDGESGIFREGYKGERQNLPQIRLREVKAALEVLGCDFFIRFGLPNHPYNGLADVLTTGEVLDSWGGREALAERIAGVISILQPGIIVSPDGPSAAREHFEHETAGIAVAAALKYMEDKNLQLPGAHLLAVDPRQHELYPDALSVSRNNVLDRQREALRLHQTQADASVFGVDMVSAFRSEYYAIQSWNMEISPHEYPGL